MASVTKQIYSYAAATTTPCTNHIRTTGLFMLFMLMGWDNVSELQPPTGLLFFPQVMYEHGEPWWNDPDSWKPKNS
jgi:hypothetical protein